MKRSRLPAFPRHESRTRTKSSSTRHYVLDWRCGRAMSCEKLGEGGWDWNDGADRFGTFPAPYSVTFSHQVGNRLGRSLGMSFRSSRGPMGDQAPACHSRFRVAHPLPGTAARSSAQQRTTIGPWTRALGEHGRATDRSTTWNLASTNLPARPIPPQPTAAALW